MPWCSKRDFKLVWLQEEDSLNIRREHVSLLTFCYMLFLVGDSLTVCWLILNFASCATMCNSFSTTLYKKCLTTKHNMTFFDKLEYLLTTTIIQCSLKSLHIGKSYSKKTKGSRFYGTLCLCHENTKKIIKIMSV